MSSAGLDVFGWCGLTALVARAKDEQGGELLDWWLVGSLQYVLVRRDSVSSCVEVVFLLCVCGGGEAARDGRCDVRALFLVARRRRVLVSKDPRVLHCARSAKCSWVKDPRLALVHLGLVESFGRALKRQLSPEVFVVSVVATSGRSLGNLEQPTNAHDGAVLLVALRTRPRTRMLVTATAMLCGLSTPVDAKMDKTYLQLAKRLLHIAGTHPDKTLFVAVAGGPGAGKSTLAAAVARRANELSAHETHEPCVVVPMDGYHYTRAELRRLDPPDAAAFLPRRGSPWTFDAEGFCAALAALKHSGEASLPIYSRELSDPVADGVRVAAHHRIVLVEGNYLLLLDDPRWAPLGELWDERWFVRCADRAEQRRRLIARHLETWNDDKVARWGAGEAGAAARADANDVLNMDLIAPSERHADLVIDSL